MPLTARDILGFVTSETPVNVGTALALQGARGMREGVAMKNANIHAGRDRAQRLKEHEDTMAWNRDQLNMRMEAERQQRMAEERAADMMQATKLRTHAIEQEMWGNTNAALAWHEEANLLEGKWNKHGPPPPGGPVTDPFGRLAMPPGQMAPQQVTRPQGAPQPAPPAPGQTPLPSVLDDPGAISYQAQTAPAAQGAGVSSQAEVIPGQLGQLANQAAGQMQQQLSSGAPLRLMDIGFAASGPIMGPGPKGQNFAPMENPVPLSTGARIGPWAGYHVGQDRAIAASEVRQAFTAFVQSGDPNPDWGIAKSIVESADAMVAATGGNRAKATQMLMDAYLKRKRAEEMGASARLKIGIDQMKAEAKAKKGGKGGSFNPNEITREDDVAFNQEADRQWKNNATYNDTKAALQSIRSLQSSMQALKNRGGKWTTAHTAAIKEFALALEGSGARLTNQDYELIASGRGLSDAARNFIAANDFDAMEKGGAYSSQQLDRILAASENILRKHKATFAAGYEGHKRAWEEEGNPYIKNHIAERLWTYYPTLAQKDGIPKPAKASVRRTREGKAFKTKIDYKGLDASGQGGNDDAAAAQLLESLK